ELGVDADRHEKWRHILEHLSGWSYHELRLPHAPGEDRSVQKPKVKVFRYTERGTPWWRNNTLGIQHIYPAGAIGLDGPPDVLEVARNTIDVRNGWRDGNGTNSFYPAAVRVGYDAGAILAKLREMVRTLGAPNGFHKRNPHGIENCSTVPNTINEMLCMGHKGVLRVFPVWPRDRDARFGNIRAWGAFLVSSELRDGRVRYVKIVSARGRECRMVNPWPGERVVVTRGDARADTVEGERFTLETTTGETLDLRPAQD
ncbi:MAG: glycosyl hydrolase family 95 catalytic domain-containing protein, partial [Planctomycetota bacterium]